MSSKDFVILAPHHEAHEHVRVCFFIVANVLKYGIVSAGHTCGIVLDIDDCQHKESVSPRLKELLTDKTVVVFSPFYEALGGIDCKIVVYNSESLGLESWRTKLDNWLHDPRVEQIWDYCYNNIIIAAEESSRCAKPHVFVPVGYSPENHFPIAQHKKILDIVFYGSHVGFERREKILKDIQADPGVFTGYKSDCLDPGFYASHYPELNLHHLDDVHRHWLRHGQYEGRICCGENNSLKNLWVGSFRNLGQKLDYIGASKIVLIVHTYHCDQPIDYFRMIELIKNKCFFIMEKPQESEISLYTRYKDYIVFADYDNIVTTCLEYLNKSQAERDAIATRLYDYWKREEDMGIPVKSALA